MGSNPQSPPNSGVKNEYAVFVAGIVIQANERLKPVEGKSLSGRLPAAGLRTISERRFLLGN